MTATQVLVVEKFVVNSSVKPFHAGQTKRICSPIRLNPRAGRVSLSRTDTVPPEHNCVEGSNGRVDRCGKPNGRNCPNAKRSQKDCEGSYKSSIPMPRPHIFSPSSLNFLNASALPLASSTGLCVCWVTRYFFQSDPWYASLTRPA